MNVLNKLGMGVKKSKTKDFFFFVEKKKKNLKKNKKETDGYEF